MARFVALLACGLSALHCASCTATRANDAPRATLELRRLVAGEDWFAVRALLEQESRPRDAEHLYFAARCRAAFNQCRRSSELATAALAGGTLTAQQRLDLGRLLAANALRMTNWTAGYQATQALLRQNASLPAAEITALHNLDAIFDTLRDTPPRTVHIDRDFVLAPNARGRTPLTIDGHAQAFAIDTGANISVIMRSVAETIGLQIRQAGIRVGTSLEAAVLADLAVADHVVIGEAHFHNVPFLVFPDAMLTFGADVRIPGLIGFGELEAMDEIRFLSGGRLGVYRDPPQRSERNMMLDGLDAIVEFSCRGVSSLARVDTGANHTVFYAPFLADHRTYIESVGTSGTQKTGGIGNVTELPVWRVPLLQIRLAGRSIAIDDASVYRQPMPNVDGGRIHANLGQDLITQFEEVILNFRTMSFELVPSP